MTREGHCASGKLIVACVGRTGGLSRPLGESRGGVEVDAEATCGPWNRGRSNPR